jgi:hypothetical protein
MNKKTLYGLYAPHSCTVTLLILVHTSTSLSTPGKWDFNPPEHGEERFDLEPIVSLEQITTYFIDQLQEKIVKYY